MPISREEYARRLKFALSVYPEFSRKSALRRANDMLSLIKARVIEKGMNEDDQPYDDYSTNQLPAFYFKGRSRAEQLAGGPKQYASGGDSPPYTKLIKGGDLSYEAWRKANGLQAEHRDFFFTGMMWKGVKIILKRLIKGFALVRIGATDRDLQDKWKWNTERDGPILAVSKEEEKVIALSRKKDIVDHFNKIFR